MSALYEDDILLWSERQCDLLRRIARGEPVNEPPDWANIIDERPARPAGFSRNVR
jgi:hypothetical protein